MNRGGVNLYLVVGYRIGDLRGHTDPIVLGRKTENHMTSAVV